jgi:hypothetical protein
MKKCELFKHEIVYLGFVISWKGLSMALEKVKDILEWIALCNVHEVRRFHDFARFYIK